MEPADIFEITLDRGPCLGTCPVFRFAASRQYGYSYEGRSYAEPGGTRSGRVPAYLFDRLAAVCVELRVLELDDVYPSHFDDAPSVAITVRHCRGTKSVRSEGGDSASVRLWAFAALVEVVMREAFFIEDRDSRSTGKRGKPRT